MNARQKAKKYKMVYEALLKEKPHIVFHEVPCPPIDTLSIDMILPEPSALVGDDYIRSFIIDSLADELKKCPEKYIDGYTEYLPYDGRPHLRYQIKVVRRQPKYEKEVLYGLHANMVSIDEFFGNKKENESEE